ncbi:hypothetical protein GOP47_0016801 [Adiantum capillus-veneris]|uniref:Uncharacterized protein n=1 Tax=Adiantum capillus-veneris TaxID=13818 RepID=A0A9D4ZDB7_ADICA|nr:hypothetical protein GOP47_0016801 [Adiantum capillus-veneris]
MASHQLLASFLVLLLLFMQASLSSSSSTPLDFEDDSSLSLEDSFHRRHVLGFDCSGKCNGRCGAAGARKRCLQMCMICCNKCQCVPPGTVGNKEACPCYANLLNIFGTLSMVYILIKAWLSMISFSKSKSPNYDIFLQEPHIC